MELEVDSGRGKRGRAETADAAKKHKPFLSFDGFEKAATNISKGMKKVKRNYMEKVLSFEPTAEPPEMADALKQFEVIQQRMQSLSDDTVTNLYDASVNKAQQKLNLSEKLMSLQSVDSGGGDTNDQDLFRTFADHVVGRKLFKINHMTNEYLVKMEKELINPLSIYRSKEMSKATQLVSAYKELKDEYDYAHHKYTKLVNAKNEKLKHRDSPKKGGPLKRTKSPRKERAKSHDHPSNEKEDSKIHSAELKMFEKYKPLQEARHHLLDSIHDLQRKQQCDLLQCIDHFWASFRIFS